MKRAMVNLAVSVLLSAGAIFTSGAIELSEGWTADGEDVVLPHTWNAVDAADGVGRAPDASEVGYSSGATSYVRKVVAYRRALPDPKPGKRYFLRCAGASVKAETRVNGQLVGRHIGAFTGFCHELTPALRTTGNEVEIRVDSRVDWDVQPIHADFSVYGGLYRVPELLETDPVCIDRVTDGACGVTIEADAKTGDVVANVRVLGGTNEVQRFHFDNPRLWSPETPNLYAVDVKIAQKGSADSMRVRFGFRTAEFRADGFYLNGRRRKLRGVNRHQDREGRGWCRSREDEAEDVRWMKRMGADAVRTSHYPQSPAFYDLCDEMGLLVWTEVPNVNGLTFTEAARANELREAREMVMQHRNHPSVFVWGIFNELYNKRMPEGSAEPRMCALRDFVKALDPSRAVTSASCKLDRMALNAITEAVGFNLYPGWYGRASTEMGDVLAEVRDRNPTRQTFAVSEYGCSGCISQHADVKYRAPSTTSPFHPEEYQAYHHWGNYRAIAADPLVWGSFVWVMFDNGSDARREGARFGINDKGLVTWDRSTPKDAFFFYKANWNPEPEVHLVGVRRSETTDGTATVMVFSNVGDVTLTVNGKTVGTKAPDDVRTVMWEDVPLEMGANEITVASGIFHRTARWVRTAAVFSAKSPDGANEIRLETGTNLTYSVWRNGEARVAPTAISMNLRGRGELGPDAKAAGAESARAGGKTPTALWKKATLDDSRNETLVRFEGGWSVRLAARDDSVAYRFETDFGGEIEVLGETADVTLPSGDLVCLHNLTNEKPYGGDPFQVSWEQVTRTAAAKNVEAPENRRHVYAPMLVRFGGDEVMGVFESDLRDYPKRDFAKERGGATFRGVFARIPDERTVENTRRYIRVHDRIDPIAVTRGTRTYPWRLFLLESSPVRLCASEAVNAFASPNALGDVSWVKPGKVAWEWWNDWNVSGVPFKAGSTAFRNVNMETYRHYIDFAAEFGIEYVIMDEGWSRNLDVMQIIPGIDMPGLIDYARTKGVGIILWCSWPQLVGRQREVLGRFAKMGAKGFKIDFMDRGDQTVVKFMEETAKVAADLRLILDYHGAFPPCGFSRTYPNVVNYEGVFGLEQAKWCSPETDFPANDLTTFFVRMTAGPLDYTPGAMINHTRYRAKPAPSGFRSDYLKPGSQGTRVHQMALLSLYEAPLQMLCDSPTRYRRNAECFRFMAKVPTVWDDTVGLAGDPSRFVLAARRKGAVWYVSGIASWEGAAAEADLSFLGPGEWTAEIFEDGVNAEHDAEDYVRRVVTVKSGDRFPVTMGPGGGFTMRVSKEEDGQ